MKLSRRELIKLSAIASVGLAVTGRWAFDAPGGRHVNPNPIENKNGAGHLCGSCPFLFLRQIAFCHASVF